MQQFALRKKEKNLTQFNVFLYFICSETKNSDQSSINPATATVAKKLLDSSTSSAPEVSVKQISPVKMDSASSEVSSTVISEDASPSKSEPNNNNVGETKSSSQSQSGVRAADKLLYLAKLFKFEVRFLKIFPKSCIHFNFFAHLNSYFRLNSVVFRRAVITIISH